MNLVVLPAVKATESQYPLLYSIWQKNNGMDPLQTRLDLALQMLKQVKSHVSNSSTRWVAMDSWYYAKDFYLAIEKLEFDWVTKAKSKTALYQKEIIRGHLP